MGKRFFSKSTVWNKIPCSLEDLNLSITLSGGQSFRWHKAENNVWQGVLAGHVWSLKQDVCGNLLYHVHNNQNEKVKKVKSLDGINGKCEHSEQASGETDFEKTLKNYFRLDINVVKLFSDWSLVDENFKKVGCHFPGVRILRQDPTENLFSFICSSNNNIPRITSMVEKLCTKYGKKIHQEDSKTFYSFPSVEALAGDDVEDALRSLGFGYRAKYISQSAKFIVENHTSEWLESLREVPYEDAHNALLKLPGVGAKVADCVCLMSLDKLCAIPVDTHVWQITVRDYLPHLKGTKSLTDKIYRQIGDFYRERFGDYAGWANTVLFAADLRQFKNHKK